jgi:micrococcal nuclease
VTTYTVPARIVRTVDGDTLRVNLDLGWGIWLRNEPIRLAGINAPETSTTEGVQARDFLAGILEQPIAVGTECSFVSHGFDKYRRALGVLIVPSVGNLSELMLSAGHAVAYP